MPKICGILITYNPDVEFFKLQINKLIRQLDYLIIVDNNSASQYEIRNISSLASGSIIFQDLDDNYGLSAAQNIGVKIAVNLCATHIILFDQDSLIEDDFVRGLLEAETALFSMGKKVAAVGPIFFDPVNNLFYPATVYVGPFLKRVFLNKKNPEVEATFVIASGCLIGMDALNKIGLMNEGLFIDYIDVEWSLRARSFGFNVYITSRARMAHTVGESRVNILGRTISIHSPLRRYYLIRNSFFMLRQSYIPFGYKLREVSFNILRFLIGFVFSKERKKYIYYAYWGVRDGIFGIFGSCKHRL